MSISGRKRDQVRNGRQRFINEANTNRKRTADDNSPESNETENAVDQIIPLLPRHGVSLFVDDGNGERFARLFTDTWKRIPMAVRRSILRHWRESPITMDSMEFSALIESRKLTLI